MSFVSKKELQKEIVDLKEQIKQLEKIVINDELKYLREQKKLFDEQTELLKGVQFRVKDVKAIKNEITDETQIRIVYQLPVIILNVDDDGKPSKNDFFYSVNSLGLISLEDTEKLVKCIDNVKNEKQKTKNS